MRSNVAMFYESSYVCAFLLLSYNKRLIAIVNVDQIHFHNSLVIKLAKLKINPLVFANK